VEHPPFPVLTAISWKRSPLKSSKSPLKYSGLENISLPARILGVRSVGKKLVFTIENPSPEEREGDQILVSSLGMTGRWFWSNRAANEFYQQENVVHVASAETPAKTPSPKKSPARDFSPPSLPRAKPKLWPST